MPVESHLVKGYRQRFDTYFTNRYKIRAQRKLDLLPYLVPFIEALGFSPVHTGVRYLPVTNDVYETVCNLVEFVVQCKEREGKVFSMIERRTITSLGAAAFLYSVGHDETARYLAVEREYLHRFGKDIDRARIYAKEAYLCLATRFDQYLTTSPITPIKWSYIEKMAPSSQSMWSVSMRDMRSPYAKRVDRQYTAATSLFPQQIKLLTLPSSGLRIISNEDGARRHTNQELPV